MNEDKEKAIDNFKSAVHHLYYGPANDLDWQVNEEKEEPPSLEKVAEMVAQAKDAIADIEAKFAIVKKWDSRPDCNGTGYTSDGGNVFSCYCQLGEIPDQPAGDEGDPAFDLVKRWENDNEP